MEWSQPVHTEEEANERRTSMAANGNYSLCMTDCDVISICGSCGAECCQFLRGECIEPWDLIEGLKENQPLTLGMYILIEEYEEAHEAAVKKHNDSQAKT